MSLILDAKRDLIERLGRAEENYEPFHEVVDDWCEEWLIGYYGLSTIKPGPGNPYTDCPLTLRHARENTKKRITDGIVKEDVFDEWADIDRSKRMMKLMIYVLKAPTKDGED